MHIEINYALIRPFKYTLNVRSLRKPVSFVFPRVLMFPETKSREISRLERKKKTNWFPEGPDIKYFVVFLVFHFNSNKRIT